MKFLGSIPNEKIMAHCWMRQLGKLGKIYGKVALQFFTFPILSIIRYSP